MHVNIVVGTTDLQWIGGRLARELVARLPRFGIEATLNDERADFDYHQIVYGEPERRPAIGMFTHGDFRPHRFASAYDGHLSMNTAVRDFLIEGGAPHPAVIELAVSEMFRRERPLVFGVAGRTYSDGRKGEHLVAKMVESGYNVIAWGSGWPCKIISANLDDLRLFYRSIDYYVDTSSDEGGCVPALEAMALGIPVISHTVGVTRPVISYERHNWESLEQVLRKLTVPRTYDDWAREHAAYFRLCEQRLEHTATVGAV